MESIKSFFYCLSPAYIALAAVEIFVFFVSLYVGVSLELHNFYHLLEYFEVLIPEASLFALVMFLSLAAAGLYQRRLKEGRSGMLLRLITGIIVGVLMISQISYTIPALDMGHTIWLSVIGIAFSSIFLLRMALFPRLEAIALRRRVLILGEGRVSKILQEDLTSLRKPAYELVDILPLQILANPQRKRKNFDLLALAQQKKIDEIIVVLHAHDQTFNTEPLLQCKFYGISVTDIVAFYERESGKIMLSCLFPSWFLLAKGFQRGAWVKAIKRCTDLLFSILIFIISLPVILLVALAVWVEGGGKAPVVFKQKRVGENGKLFELLKFRSMRVDAEKNGPQWASDNDARVTRVGRFIRKTRLDEFPQLFNVFKGEMSFVGPRPERPEFVIELAKKIPFYHERHVIKPGITGWAQVCYSYGSSAQDSYEKLQYDLYYVKNYSLFLDFVILLQTVEVLLLRRGAR
ncbi:MAG TPA: TIGR03013 family XrtA/PEP-CTERM system glycosyltransferase [Gammaproteobacteria bacterium]|nr:TIGR03013 family XrtA/PEP-CTERM system glycosyltransferase [Gammaproteobacteria bacterium]